jgi:hypothetical protein
VLRKLLLVVSVVAVSPCLLAAGGSGAVADSITLTNLVPNPNNVARTIMGSGTCQSDNVIVGVTFYAALKPGNQKVSDSTDPDNNGNWSKTLGVVAGTYDGYAYLGTTPDGETVVETKSNVWSDNHNLVQVN